MNREIPRAPVMNLMPWRTSPVQIKPRWVQALLRLIDQHDSSRLRKAYPEALRI
jgi:hypothetical protein